MTELSPLNKQTNYQVAYDRALRAARAQENDGYLALGAERIEDGVYTLPVLDATFAVDLDAGCVTRHGLPRDKAEIGLPWKVIALHYLASRTPPPATSSWVSFGDLAEARGYESVYRGRVLGRLCATAGRTRDGFVAACKSLSATTIDWGDEGFEFPGFPKLHLAIAWYDGGDEFPPNAALLYPDTVLSLLPVEDVIVLSECLVSRLQGKGW